MVSLTGLLVFLKPERSGRVEESNCWCTLVTLMSCSPIGWQTPSRSLIGLETLSQDLVGWETPSPSPIGWEMPLHSLIGWETPSRSPIGWEATWKASPQSKSRRNFTFSFCALESCTLKACSFYKWRIQISNAKVCSSITYLSILQEHITIIYNMKKTKVNVADRTYEYGTHKHK